VQLDFEDWTPIWEENVGTGPYHGRRYQEYSIELVGRSHPHLNTSAAEALAKEQYESATLKWFVQILDHLHHLRPRAHFAWYGVPDTTSYWNNYWDPRQGPILRARNDRLTPLWAASGWLAPCVYLSDGFTPSQQWKHVHAGAQEAVRCAKEGAKYAVRRQRLPGHASPAVPPPPPVIAIQWNFYHLSRTGKVGDGWKPVSATDMPIPFLAAYAAGAAGVISWDCPAAFAPHFVGPGCPKNATKDAMVECRVNATRRLIRTSMGPMVKSMLARIVACAKANCSNHGRCSLLPWVGSAAYYPSPPHRNDELCVCDAGWVGTHCADSRSRLKTDELLSSRVYLAVDPNAVVQSQQAEPDKVVFGPVHTLPHPLLSQDRPWEAAWLNTYPTAAWEPKAGKVMLWYNTLSQCSDGQFASAGMCPHPGYPREWRASTNHEMRTATCLAESADGLSNWVKPVLGVVPFNGSKANNIVIDAGNVDGNRGVLHDLHESNASRRFKLIGGLNTSGNATFCSWSARTVSIAMSADGVHWHGIRNVSGQMQVAADTANALVFDESLGKYLAFSRRHCNTEYATPPWCTGNATEFGVRREVRSVSLTLDFATTDWTYGREVAHGLENDELYSLVPWRSPSWRAGLYFAVASYYQRLPHGHVTCELVMSPDFGQHWIRVAPHQQFIPLGKNGSFNSHTCFSANGLVMSPSIGRRGSADNREVRFYFAGEQASTIDPRVIDKH
jgi:hypothetical protein